MFRVAIGLIKTVVRQAGDIKTLSLWVLLIFPSL